MNRATRLHLRGMVRRACGLVFAGSVLTGSALTGSVLSSSALVGSVLTSLVLEGCAAPSRIAASRDDYELYRRARLAPTLEERLEAGWSYLKHRPDGRFRSELSTWFKQAEPAYFESVGHSRPRIEAYLSYLPDGPHAEQARARLLALEQARAKAAKSKLAELKRARAIEDQLEAARKARLDFVHEVVAYTRLLARLRTFGERTHELEPRFLRKYRFQSPQAVCGQELCEKSLRFEYEIPKDGKLVKRVATFGVFVRLKDGAVQSAHLEGPMLFSRMGEALQLRPADTPQRRAEAIGQAVHVVAAALSASLPEAECPGEVISPVVLERRCDRVLFQMVAAIEPSQKDRIEIRPIKPGGATPP